MKEKIKTSFEQWGIQCHSGWATLYDPIIQEVMKLNGTILQVKEKFGCLRIYFMLPSDVCPDAKRRLSILAAKAEETSSKVCEICGNPGGIIKDGGWYRVRCEEHAVYRAQ